MATLIAPEDFSAAEDALDIKKACLGLGTDEKVIISILGHRNSFQRKLIRQAYHEIYQEDLIKQLKSELSGHFEEAMCHWTLDPVDRDATLANKALHRTPPDCRVLIEIACIRSPEDLLTVKRAYCSLYNHSLEEDVASRTTGDIRKLLVGMVSCYRFDGEEIDEGVSVSEANILHDEIKEKAYNHEEMIRILSTRSKAQLNATFKRYRYIYGTSIRKGLMCDPTNEYLTALHTVIECIQDPKKHYVKVLRNATNTAQGIDKDALSHVILTRAEKDLKDIKELYLKKNKVSLDDVVARATFGDNKSFLLALLGNEEN
ncbi:annexin D8 [Tripterygium wilfordii]|uniref:annexin D8 n=1 Tax=Tripterygium wilfordii TaxID=458696 RepID=UPI0018F83756|nr:annexin D8 [Tripterygium wilfordii]